MTATTKLKRVARLTAGGTPTVDEPRYWDEQGLPWVSIGDMSDGRPVHTTARGVSAEGIAAKGLPTGQPGTLLFAMYASVGAVGTLGVEGTWNQALLGIEPIAGLADERFIRYWLQHLRPTLSALSRSNTQDNLNAEQVGDFPFPTLGNAAQRAIADYLDAETARIDTLIANKRRLIQLLDERRWKLLGTIIAGERAPEVPLRRAFTFITDGPFGSAFSSSGYTDEGLGVVRLGNIGFAEWRGEDLACLPLDRWSEFQRFTVRGGDLLLAGLGDVNNHAGRACVAPGGGAMIVKGKCFCARIDPRMANADYLALFCSSPSGAERIAVETRGSTRQMINLEIIKSVVVPMPSPARQAEIASSVRSAWRRSDALRTRVNQQIDLLVEHRQALITAAVTGELAIPGAA